MKMGRTHLWTLLLEHLPIVMFVVVFIVFGLVSPSFLEWKSLVNAVKQASDVGILAVGMTFVLLTAGIDLSVGSNMYLSAAVAGLLINQFHVPIALACAACLGVGLLFGAVNALIVTRLGVIPFVATLSTMVAGRGLGLMITKSHVVNFPDRLSGLGAMTLLGIPFPILIFAAVVGVAWLLLHRTTPGRQLYAVGHHPENARKAGIKTSRRLALAYILCGGFAALGGLISVIQLGNLNAGFGKGDEFDAISAAVLGGVSLFGGIGSVFPGVVLGAVLIQMIDTGLVVAQINLYLNPLVAAAIIFIAVLLDSIRTTQLKKLSKRNIRIDV